MTTKTVGEEDDGDEKDNEDKEYKIGWPDKTASQILEENFPSG